MFISRASNLNYGAIWIRTFDDAAEIKTFQ